MKAKYLSLLALSALLVSCGPSTSAPTTSVEEPSSDPTTSEVPTTTTSDPTTDPTVPPFVGPSSVGLIGSMEESNWETDIPLTGDSEGKVWTLSDYPFSAGDEWKLRADGAWDWQWSFDNLDEASAALFENAGGYGNVKVLTSAYYSISVNAETDVVSVVKGEDIVPDEPDVPDTPDVPDVPEGPSWPGEEFQELVYTATGSEVVVPAFEGASEYELNESGVGSGEAYIYCYTEDAEAATAYEEVLVAAGWELFVDEEWYGTCAIDPSGELVVSYEYAEEYGSLDLCVFAYEEPGEGGEEGELTPESILYDYLDSIGLTGGSVTVSGDEAYFAYKITNFDSIQELCEVATYNAPTYLTLAVEPTQDELTTGGECWYSVLTTEDNSIAVEVLTYWATETEPVLQVLAYYL